MNELQLALLLAGAVVVAGVYAWNRYHEHRAARTRPQADRRTSAARVEPVESPRPAALLALQNGRVPDPRIDYVIELQPATPLPAAVVVEAWHTHAHRFGALVTLAASDAAGAWGAIRDPHRPAAAFRFGLQLCSQGGAVRETDLLEFRAALETVAQRLGAQVSAPELRSAIARADALDRFCVENDVQLVLRLFAGKGAPLAAQRIGEAAQAQGLVPDGAGGYVYRDGRGQTLWRLAPEAGRDAEPVYGFALDVAHVEDAPAAFAQMHRSAEAIAHAVHARLADEEGRVLDEAAIAAIAARLDELAGRFAAAGIPTGSALARSLFS